MSMSNNSMIFQVIFSSYLFVHRNSPIPCICIKAVPKSHQEQQYRYIVIG